MRNLIVGDVHGCRLELEELLDVFGFVAGTDQLVMVGDLVNKGPDTLGVLDLLERVQGLAVRGNHEAKLLAIAAKPLSQWTPKETKTAVKMLFGHGMEPPVPLEQVAEQISMLAQRVQTWPFWRDLGSCLVVHAGLEPGRQRLEDMDPRVLMTIRTWDGNGTVLEAPNDPPWYDCVRWEKPVVFGHWALNGLVNLPHAKGLDTGCVYGRSLTAWCPEQDQLYSVQAHKEYAPLKRD